jgi:hypothetical protein
MQRIASLWDFAHCGVQHRSSGGHKGDISLVLTVLAGKTFSMGPGCLYPAPCRAQDIIAGLFRLSSRLHQASQMPSELPRRAFIIFVRLGQHNFSNHSKLAARGHIPNIMIVGTVEPLGVIWAR